MKYLAFLAIWLALPLAAQTAKDKQPQPETLPVMTLPYHLSSNVLTTTNVSIMDSFQINDDKGLLAVCQTRDLDTDVFTGCRLAEGRTLDDLMRAFFKAFRKYEAIRKESKP
jgi:hypothetical protein